MKGFIYNRHFTIDGVRCEYCGQIIASDGKGHDYHCVVIKVEDIGKIHQWDTPRISSSSYDYFGLCKNYGIEYTDYGKEQVRKAGGYVPSLTWSDGKMTHELSRSDFKPEYQQVYDDTRNKGGGYVVLSPFVSSLYLWGNIFRK